MRRIRARSSRESTRPGSADDGHEIGIDKRRRCHVSGLTADGWDPVEIAARIGDTLATTLAIYSHEFDARRRGAAQRQALEPRYDAGMATHTPRQGATAANGRIGEVVYLQAIRDMGQ
jgi:hypothetical protein